MAEQPKITLDNWKLWMSVDEYTWWSFLYNHWIDVTSNTKCFTLWPNVSKNNMNRRSNGYINTILDGGIVLTRDWYIEELWLYYPYSTDDTFWWWFYRQLYAYVNGIKLGNTILWIKSDKIDRIDDRLNCTDANIVANPSLTSDSDWTVWAWWTTSAAWATHVAGWGTNTLTQTVVTDWTSMYLVRVKVGWITYWTCTVKWDNTTMFTLSTTTPYWEIYVKTATTANVPITFTPQDWFVWRIEYVSVAPYNSNIHPDDMTITSATEHPICDSAGLLYIWSWAKLDVIDKTTWTVETLSIIDENYTIKDITSIGNQFIIWATNWVDTKYYYWNWVDDQASESITRKWVVLTNAYTDWNVTYVVIQWDLPYSQVYIVNWYERTLLTRYKYTWVRSYDYVDWYNPIKKNDFHLNNTNCISTWDGILYLPSYWCIYSYGNKIPFMDNAWSNEIVFETPWLSWYEVNAMCYYSGSRSCLSFSYKIPNSYNVLWSVNRYNTTTTWYLVTNPILRDNLSTEKFLTKLKIWYKNIKSTYGNIKIYAIVDDFKFFTFNVTWLTTDPIVWDIYRDSSNMITQMEVISTDLTWHAGTITFKTLTANYFNNTIPWELVKVSWTWDASITWFSSFNNMVLLKTIESDWPEYWSETIFSQAFIDAHMPNWRKLQLVIELNSSSTSNSPEIYDIQILSDIVN